MVKVDSRPTIKLLSRQFLKVNRGRNQIAILAIIMTSVMFTSLFTAAASLIKSDRQQQMRSVMDAAHITIQDLTREQYEQIRQDPLLEEYGLTIFMNVAENEELKNSQVEMRYAAENGAKGYMSQPTKGRMPKHENEIALSTITLDVLGIPHEIGSEVSITTTLSGQKMTTEFVLSGYWVGDPFFMAQEAWVSKEFCQKYCKEATAEAIEQDDFEGSYNLSLWFDNILKLSTYMDELDNTYHISDSQARIGINPAFDIFAEDAFPVGTILAVLVIIFISGYLIIFNIFNISVKKDAYAYGLLKNIGTTGRQLKSIVIRQAFFLSMVGIPAGLVIGYFVGSKMTPYLIKSEVGNSMEPEVLISANPLLFAGAAIFSLCTIYTACLRPCSVVARLSPVEAVKVTGSDGRGNRKAVGKITPLYMAFSNIRRTWKKVIVVILSLALPIMILNAVYIIRSGFNFDQFVDVYISSDFNISGCTNNLFSSNLKALTPKIQQDLAQQSLVETAAFVYDTETTHTLTDQGVDNLDGIIKAAKEADALSKDKIEKEAAILEHRQVVTHLLGIDENSFQKMSFIGGAVTWEEFKKGDYIIVGSESHGWGTYYEPGAPVEIQFENGTGKQYTVLAVGDLPYDMNYPFGSGTYFDYTFHLPSEEYVKMSQNTNALRAGIEVKTDKEGEFAGWLEQYVEENELSLYTTSVIGLQEDASQFAKKYYLVLGLLGLVIFAIGILNFFNTSAVSLISRRRELSLLEAVGMTRKQAKKMLVCEGLAYLTAAFLLANTIGIPIISFIVKNTVGRAFYFQYHFTIIASVWVLPVLLLIAVCIPLYNYQSICKESIVERIRIAD